MSPRFWFAPLRLLPLLVATLTLHARLPEPTRQPLHRSLDLALGETAEVTLNDGSTAKVRLLDLEERVDSMSAAVRA